MDSIRCSNCGLVNGPQDSRCRRCGQAFTASPYMDAVVNERASWQAESPGQAVPYGGHYAPAPAWGQPLFDRDAEHLRLLTYAYYITGGITALVACIPLVHIVTGIAMISGVFDTGRPGDDPPEIVGWILLAVGSIVLILGQTLAICTIFAGRFLKQRRRWLFCFIVACIHCMHFPVGTALGVSTIVVLVRDSVKKAFGHRV